MPNKMPDRFVPFDADASVPQYSKMPSRFTPYDGAAQVPSDDTDWTDFLAVKAKQGLTTLAELPVKGGAVLGIPGAQQNVEAMERYKQQQEASLPQAVQQRGQLFTDKGEFNPTPESIIGGVVEGIPSAVPYLAAGALAPETGGGSLLALGAVGGVTGGTDAYQEAYERARANGMSEADSRNLALKTSAVGAGIGAGLSAVGGAMAHKAAAGFEGRVGRAVAGAAGFTPAAATQAAADSITQDVMQGKEPDLRKAYHSAISSAIGNLATGSVLGLASKGKSRPEEVPPEPTPEPSEPVETPEEAAIRLRQQEREQRAARLQDLGSQVPQTIPTTEAPPAPAVGVSGTEEQVGGTGPFKFKTVGNEQAVIEAQKKAEQEQKKKAEAEAFDRQAREAAQGVNKETTFEESVAPDILKQQLDTAIEQGNKEAAQIAADKIYKALDTERANKQLEQMEKEKAAKRAADAADKEERRKAGIQAEADYQAMRNQKPKTPTEAVTPEAHEETVAAAQPTETESDFAMGHELKLSHGDGSGPNPYAGRAKVMSWAKDFLNQFKIRPKVETYGGLEDLHPEVRARVEAEMKKAGMKTAPRAFKDGDTIYLNHNKLGSAVEVQTEMGHEGVGHIATEIHLGKRADPVYERISRDRADDIQKMGIKHNPIDYADRVRAGAEYVAKVAQTNPKSTIVSKVIDFYMKTIRQLGYKGRLTRSEILENYILPAREMMRTGSFNPKFKEMSTEFLSDMYKSEVHQAAVFGDKSSRTEAKLREMEEELLKRERTAPMMAEGKTRLQAGKRTPTKQLLEIRKQFQHELDYDQHITPERIEQLKLHLQEIDDEIHDNNVAAMRDMVKAGKKLTPVPKREMPSTTGPSKMTIEEARQFNEEPNLEKNSVTAKFKPEARGAANEPESKTKLQHSEDEELSDKEKAHVSRLVQDIRGLNKLRKQLFDPLSLSPQAEEAGSKLKSLGGKSTRDMVAVNKAIKKTAKNVEKVIKKWSDTKRVRFFESVLKGEKQSNPNLQEVANFMKSLMDKTHQTLKSQSPEATKDYVHDFMPGIFENPKEVQKWLDRVVKDAELKGIKDYIPSIKDAMDAGFRPISTNPLELTMYRVQEMNRYMLGRTWLKDAADKGMAKLFTNDQQPDPGYVKLNPIFAKTLSAKSAGKKAGQWYVPEEVGQVIDNYLSPGLRKYPGFDSYMRMANTLNQAQLGLSGFHAAFTTFDVMNGSLAMALQDVTQGKLGSAGARVLKAPFAALSSYSSAGKGAKLLEAYDDPTKHPELQPMIKLMELGGFRPRDIKWYETKHWERFTNALAQGKKMEAAKGAVGGALDLFAKPIMEHLVPRQKALMFSMMAERSMARSKALGETDEQFIKRLQNDAASVDNRLGQLSYDNLFWHRMAKDLMMATTRSVGWNVGTIREFFGGAYRLGERASGLFTGKHGGELTNHEAYFVSTMLLTGLMGGILTKVLSGDNPKEWKDYYYPKTGQTDLNGYDLRMSPPSYSKDFFSVAHDPIKTAIDKMNPAISTIHDIITNKDFFGNEIWHEEDNLAAQFLDGAKYMGQQFLPFGLRNIFGDTKNPYLEGFPKAGAAIGFPKAPNWVEQTPAAGLASDLLKRELSSSAKTKEEAERYQLANQISGGFQNPDPKIQARAQKMLDEAEAAGKLLPTDLNRIDKKQEIGDPLVYQVTKIHNTLSVMKVWRAASKAEKKRIEDTVYNKIQNSQTISEERRDEYLEELDKGAGK